MTTSSFHDTSTQAHARDAAANTAFPDDGHGRYAGSSWGRAVVPVAITHHPTHVDMSWNDGSGLCTNHNPSLWFVRSSDPRDHADAVAICLTPCPLLEPCRRHGLEHETQGTWGGLTPKARREHHKNAGAKKAGRPMEPIRHGTSWGYAKHLQHPDIFGAPCAECRHAVNAAKNKRRARAKQTT